MADILLVATFLAVASLGFLLMARLDKFLENNRKSIARKERGETRPYIIFSDTAKEENKDKSKKSRRNSD